MRSSDRLALALWYQLAARGVADRRLVLDALGARGDDGRHTPRQQRLLEALTVCAGDLGHVPSRREWDAWRGQQPDPRQWPSATALRNAFGASWTRVRQAAGGTSSPDVLASRLAAVGGAFTAAELAGGLHAAAAAFAPQPLTFEGYLRWAHDESRRRGPAGPRIACSGKPFRRLFGTWAGALHHAGIAAPPPRAWGRAYATQAMLDGLRAAANDTGLGAELPPAAYDAWVRDRRTTADGRPMARAATISRHFDGWADALVAAGMLSDSNARRRRARVGVPMTDPELLGWVARAKADLGPAMTRGQYAVWRTQWIAADRTPGPPPSDARLRLRFGGWGLPRLDDGEGPRASPTAP